MRAAPVLLIASLALTACGETAQLSVEKGQGTNPELPAPKKTLIPTVKVADATGWSAGDMPTAAQGLTVTAFASNLDHPRWLYVLPNGDVLVAETNAPPKPEDGKGIKGFVMGLTMKKAGAMTKSANRLTLLRDADGDGMAEVRTVFVDGLSSPFGMALVGDRLYIANADAVVSVPYATGDLKATGAPQKLTDLPGGPINHHWTKSLVASKDGKYLYAGIGSNSNVGENGMAAETDRAAILQIDVATGARTVYASGLRNPVGMDWNPVSGALWVSVNERDEIGSDLVPDYMTSVRPGGFYGWPYSYYGPHVDVRVKPQNPALVAKAIKPDYALGPHTASLGLSFYTADLLPQYKGGALIGQHGSWNRNPPSGYKVVFVPFTGATPAGPPQDVLTGFLSADGKAKGRPVGVTVDAKGAILVADDVGNIVWRVTK
ncbi:sorbosone dehydrogenase family protein [Asticcacaulis sp. BYS171W]|uniref:Sorbosone dehydrogenase family protein n=1 Tax=Asticcacaulis aquaticus TaxID=2984212 RepID=A0ABT5HXZ9_9CAUL|nr:sorbosone dehydrogenase family protein [Asticcacaulis aquaticus]MDC7684725.1 sorbosone dehydrogenase family protein [Asticcacaulis aquaticus]